MNIHFTDKELFERLKNATLAKVRVGSHLYGTNNENSDEDLLYIYATSENELKSFIWTNHQLQYKEEGIDHNFVSLHTFIRNIVNGDSTINFEVVHSDELKGTWLGFMHELRNSFNTYTIIRSYNGFAKRDCKHFSKANNDYEKRKRFGHIVRGHVYAKMLMDGEFKFTTANYAFVKILDTIIAEDGVITMNHINRYKEMLEDQRWTLNAILESKSVKLAKMMNVSDAKNMDISMRLLQDTKEFKDKQHVLKNFDMSILINAFENWVSYD